MWAERALGRERPPGSVVTWAGICPGGVCSCLAMLAPRNSRVLHSRADQHRIAFGFRSLERLSLAACARLPFSCGVRRVPCGQVRPLGLHRYRRRGRWRRPMSSLAPRRDSRVAYSLLADPAGDSRLWKFRLDSRGGGLGRRVRARLQQDVGDQQQRHEKRTDCAEIGKEGHGLRSLLTRSRKPNRTHGACGGSRARQAATAADRRESIRTPGASSSIGDYPENAREKPAAPNRRSPTPCHGPVRPHRR
jgi:hypothetical protein